MGLSFRTYEIKAAPEEGEGVFRGYASTWDRDLYDDEIVMGAYAECLENDYKGTGEGIPIFWNHDYSTPKNLVGASISAVEDEKGLDFVGKLDLDDEWGRRCYEHIKSGRIHQMSVGFSPRKPHGSSPRATSTSTARSARSSSSRSRSSPWQPTSSARSTRSRPSRQS